MTSEEARLIELRLFGGVGLTGQDGREVRSIVTRPRPLALVAYLAASRRPPGLHRRDKLLAMFWPEIDQEHARASLRQTVYVLREALGPAVLTSRGDDEIGVGGELWCDVAAFDEAAGSDRYADAMELYRGDLLDGFFLSDAPEFEHWVDAERARLRETAIRSAGALAQQHHAAGNLAAALVWARRGARLAPDDESGAQRLISLLDQSGDRAGALKVHEEFAARLRREYDAAPAPETTALINAVRSRAVPSAPPPLPAERVPVSSAPAPVPLGSRRRSLARAGLLGVAVLLSAVAAIQSRSVRAGGMDPKRVVVAPFTNQTGDSALNDIGDLVAQWIARSLTNAGLLEVADAAVADPEAAASRRRVSADSGRGAREARALAEATTAATAIWGSFYRRGDSLVFDAQITDERNSQLVGAVGPVVAPVRDPRPALAALSQRVLGNLAAATDPRLNDWMRFASGPPTYDAYRAFAAGVVASTRVGTMREALRDFYRAAALDSSFTQPLVWAAAMHHSLRECPKTDSLARALGNRRAPLPRLDQWYLDREVAQCRGDMATAYRISRRIAEELPGSEVTAELAARAAVAVNRPREAIEILTRLHPDRGLLADRAGYYYLWLTGSYHMLEEHHLELVAAQRFQREDPDRRLGMLRDQLLALAALGRVGDVQRALDEIPTYPAHANWKPTEVMRETAIELRVHGQPAASREVFRRAFAWLDTRPPEAQAAESLRFERLMTLYAAERWEDAGVLASELVREHPDSVSYHGLRGAIAARRGDTRTAALSDSVLTGLSRPTFHGIPTYWRACIAAQLGDKARAVALLQQAQAEGLQALTFPNRFGVYGYLYYDYLHRDPSFEGLRDYPPFEEMLRPKG